MKSAGKARNNGLYRHIRTSKEIIRNLLNDYHKFNISNCSGSTDLAENFIPCLGTKSVEHEHDCYAGCGKVCGSVYEYER